MASVALEHRKNVSSDTLDPKVKQSLGLIANTIRCLTIDAVHQAGSGHPGTPMGCAELGAYLYGFFLRHNLQNPRWTNRDRFVLSAGHASMLQYCCLHLGGANLSMAELKRFRQINSKTPSHPQYGTTEGVETTTGVDGQGVAHGVGQALGLKLLGARFNREGFTIYNAKVVVLAGDGCLMEGVSHEACALAGHLKLNNLILIYDRNKTSLDGLVTDSTSENTKRRYQAYGWHVYEVDGHNFDAIHRVFSKLRNKQTRPSLIIADTIIGKGIATKAGAYEFHSGALTTEQRAQVKKGCGFPEEDFFVPPEVLSYFKRKSTCDAEEETRWLHLFAQWQKKFPFLDSEFQKMASKWLPDNMEGLLTTLSLPSHLSGRKASHHVLNFLADLLPGLYGGSADLARSDMTHIDAHPVVIPAQFIGRNIKYGVREFGMAAMAIGLAQTNMITPFIGTFLSFSDYMLSAVRMAAMMKLPVIYQLTHDSIFIGQDGPTHQPIEHLAYLRAIPNLQVIRPADSNEVKMAWLAALKYAGPTALIFSRQPLLECEGTNAMYADGVGRGAYVLKEGKAADFTLIATGSEVSLALAVSQALEKHHFAARVISMPCWQLFDAQPQQYRDQVLGNVMRVSIEAGSEMGWHKYVQNGKVVSVNSFGKSATAEDLTHEFGFTVKAIVSKLLTPRSKL